MEDGRSKVWRQVQKVGNDDVDKVDKDYGMKQWLIYLV